MRIAHPSRFLISVAELSLAVSSLSLHRLRHLFPLQSLAFAMSGAPDSVDPFAAAAGGDDLKFGFQRPEMYKSSLAGTVDPPYDRHVFLCFKSPDFWPSRVENSDSDLLPKLLSSAVKSRKNDINVKTRLTICEGREGTEFSDGDVLIFPEMIKYRGLKESDVDRFVDVVLVNEKPWDSGVQVLTGSHVFVCAHGSRDRRCGVCGPVLIEKFKKETEVRGLKDQVFVSACSHIGGHKYAGNLIIFSQNLEGKVTGHWYGYVTPDDVPELLDLHIGKGEIIERLWRGQMGATPEEGEKASEEKLIPNGKDLKKSKKKLQESSNQGNQENTGGCCQGAEGFSCCRDSNSQVPEKKGVCGLSSWLGTWEQGDVLAAVAVVGAVATVAAAYSLYRKQG
ncbi:altered inheritance of mitochondria protein 32-like [Malania oleifera]|uniref:altered inheritance of mitochondria protein 32-like n=1 Tax=Malania oleifera TaxID=397392 RepID=UPI0025AE853D|nr:altered inheritance of mitochondria protein 32-like [Malania oleifera]